MTEIKRGRGRPGRDWRWLVRDVEAVQKNNKNCSVEDACGRLSDGEFSEQLAIYIPKGVHALTDKAPFTGTASVVWGQWAGMDIDTLKRKYYLAKRKKSG